MPPLRILHVEDSSRDAELVLRIIERGGLEAESFRVDTAETMQAALDEREWDVVLVDCHMPNFDSFHALDILHRHGTDIPLMIVSGTVGEETAVALMKAGAADYVMKDHLARLVPAIERELIEAGHRQARREAEARLLERERMLSTAQRVAHLGSWEHNFQAGTLWWSRELYSILGRSPDYQLSAEGSYADVAHPDDRRHVEQALDAALREGETPALEHRIVLPDGTTRWVFCRLETEFDSLGQPHRLFGTILDITERKQTEEAVRFQAWLLDTVEQAVVATDLQGQVIYWNKFAETLYGWSSAEALGQSVLDFVVAGGSSDAAAQIWERLQEGGSWSGEILLRHRDGRSFWAHVTDSPVYNELGELVGIVGISFDISEQKQAAEALRESELNYRMLLEQAADGIVVANADRQIITVNTRACEMFGYEPDEFIGLDLFSFIAPDELDANPPRLSEVLDGAIVTNERMLRRKDGSLIPTETSTKQLEDGRIQVIVRDTTERKQAEAALRRSEREYRNLFEHANDAIIILDANTHVILDANWRAIETYGIMRESLVDQNLREYIGDHAMEELTRGLRVINNGVQGVEATLRWGRARVDLLINASLVEFRGRRVILSIHRDVTVQKELERQLAHQALHDGLTGLANRALFEDRMQHALARAREDHTDVAVLMLGLDRFKLINETLGHEVGDRLLVAVAERLLGCVREDDTIARFGGDEFTILVESFTSMREVTMVAERVSNALQRSFALDGHDVIVTASIGIVIDTHGRGTSEDLLRNADIAMYRAKDAGRGGYVVFDPSMNSTMLERLKLETDLRHAIARDELRVYYQPTVELATGSVVGMEALVRWMHPTLGMMAPGAFIPLAEEAGLIRMIDQWILGAACRQLASWHARYPGSRILLNVNLSAQGFQHPDLVRDVARALADAEVPASDVQLEITESVIMTDAAATHARLGELKSLGVRLAIDDFGTGYSSLSYLNRFPVDTLKIDKSFIDGLGSDADDTAIVQAVVSLAQVLGLNVVAEGVETELATTLLQEVGCEMAQGYYYARPMPPEMLDALWAYGLRIDSPWLTPIAC